MMTDEVKQRARHLATLDATLRKAVRSVCADHPNLSNATLLTGLTRALAEVSIEAGVTKENFLMCVEDGYDLVQAIGRSDR